MSRNKYPEETRRLILDVSERLFLEKGYDKTTIEDIVAEMGGLTKGALYHHFKSKEEIILGISERIFSENNDDKYIKVLQSDLPPDKKIGAFISLIIEDKAENRFRKIYPDMKKSPLFMVIMLENSIFSAGPLRLAKILDEGINENIIKTSFPKELAQVLMLIMNFWINPYVWQTDCDGLKKKLDFTDELLGKFGISPLIEIIPKGSYEKIFQLLGN